MIQHREIRETLDSTLIISLALNDIIKDDIEKIYNQNPPLFYEIYKNSHLFEADYEEFYGVERAERIKRTTGVFIYLARHSTPTEDKVVNLMKKGYKRIYNIIKNSGGEIQTHPIMMYINKEVNNKRLIDKMSENTMFSTMTAVMFFSSVLEKPLDSMMIFEGFYKEYLLKLTVKKNEKKEFLAQEVKDREEEINELMKKYFPMKDKISSFEDINEFITFNEHRQLMDKYGTIDVSRDILHREGKASKYIGAVYGMYDAVSVRDDYMNHVFTQDDLKQICLRYIYARKTNHLPIEHEPIYIYSTFYVFAMAKEYKWVRDKYLSDSVERMYIQHTFDIEKSKANVNDLKVHLQKTIESTEKKEELLDSKVKGMEQYIHDLEKQVKHLKDQNSKLADHAREVKALRQYIEDNEKPVVEETISLEQKIRDLQRVPIIILGGRTKWVQSVSEYLPHATFITPDDRGFNLTHLRNFKGVLLINTATLSHNMTERVLQYIKDTVPVYYINRNNNRDLVVNYLHKKLR